MTVSMLPPLTIGQMIRCLDRHQCLACGEATTPDPETGFPSHLCDGCWSVLRRRIKDVSGARKFNACQRAEALSNLVTWGVDVKLGEQVVGGGSAPAPSEVPEPPSLGRPQPVVKARARKRAAKPRRRRAPAKAARRVARPKPAPANKVQGKKDADV